MRIVCISDSHGKYGGTTMDLPVGDVLVHAGDLCSFGNIRELDMAAKWLGSLKYPHIVVIGGNHDRPLQNTPLEAREVMHSQGLKYLEDEAVTIKGVKFYGSPWTPPFMSWSFMADRPTIQKHWAKIPTDTNVLITHGPPYGILDPGSGEPHAGCIDLFDEYERIHPELHVFGHLHSGYGRREVALNPNGRVTTFVNASLVDEGYNPINHAIVIDL